MLSFTRAASVALLLASLSLPAPAAAATWEVDPSHTTAAFRVRHMMVTWVRGEFGKVSGTVTYETGKVAEAKADITIDTASIDTREPKRDDHLRSPDFFDAATFPKITFKSKAVKNVTAAGFDLVGDLTIRGVTKEVTLKVEGPTQEIKDPYGNTKLGASGTVTVNRKDFGVNWNKSLDGGGIVVGDEVQVMIEVELKKVN